VATNAKAGLLKSMLVAFHSPCFLV
jgi:hypothetical protein